MRWIGSIVGFPPDAEGILVSGGSMANFTALAAARRAKTPGNVREDGLAGEGRPRLAVYASDQVHHCVDKAVDLLGIGTRNLRKIETDDRFRIRVDRLEAAIAEDRRAGLHPAIVVGSAGTVNTGAIDPLEELADLCRRESLWFHVDGAYGAMAALSPRLRPRFAGMERADSIAADPHKWLYVPYEAGATLVREPGRLAATFRKFPEYLATDPDSPFPGPAWFAERGVELSRGFKALKVWMGLQVHGAQAYAQAIENDVALARLPLRGGGPAARLREDGGTRPLDRELPLASVRLADDGGRDRPVEPADRQPPGGRRLLLPGAHDSEGARGPAGVHRQLSDVGR